MSSTPGDLIDAAHGFLRAPSSTRRSIPADVHPLAEKRKTASFIGLIDHRFPAHTSTIGGPMHSLGFGRLSPMSCLPARSQQLIDATPLGTVRTGVRTVVELTAYPDGHANIAVGSVDTSRRGEMTYARVDSLPLNHRQELEQFIAEILDRLFAKAAGER